MKVYLVIDIGTSSTLGILYNEEAVELSKTSIETAPTYKNEIVEQDVETWDSALKEILQGAGKEVLKNKYDFSGIFLTSQRSSLISLDAKGEALMPAIMWEDKRSAKSVEKFKEYEELFISKTGAKLNPVYLGAKILYLMDEYPNVYENTFKFVSIADYFRYKLTGEFITDYTYASRTSLFNIRDKKWDTDILNLFNIDESKLCEIENVGLSDSYLLADLSSKYFSGKKIPYVSSGGDQQCSAVGMGAFKSGRMALTVGTGGYLLTPSKIISENKSIIFNYHSIHDYYLAEGIMISVASTLNYFHKTFYKQLKRNEFYKLISNIIESDLKTDILHFPHYQGRGTPDWNNEAKAAYFNLTFSSTKESMLLSIVESIGFEIKNNIETFEKILSMEINQVFVAGGLANNNQIVQLLSDITGVEFIKTGYSESTSLGALVVGLSALDESFDIEMFFEKHGEKYGNQMFKNEIIKSKYYDKKNQEWNNLYNKIYNK